MRRALKFSLLPLLVGLLSCSPDPSPFKEPLEDPNFVTTKGNGTLSPFVDILFVIDDSGSMISYQTQLKENVDKFTEAISAFSSLDFHFGVITSNTITSSTRSYSGRLVDVEGRKYATKYTPNLKEDIKKRMIVGTNGSISEVFFENVRKALQDPDARTHNNGFYRSEGFLFVLFITDTDDQSRSTMRVPGNFRDFLVNDLKGGNEDLVIVSGAIADTDRTCNPEVTQPIRFRELFKEMNADYFELCGANYGAELAEVANLLINRTTVFPLEDLPRVETIRVTYGNQVIPMDPIYGWSYSPGQNAVMLGPELSVDTKRGVYFKIRYEPLIDEDDDQ